MNGRRVRLVILALILLAPVSATVLSEPCDATSYGTVSSPQSALQCTLTLNEDITAVVYPGAYVEITASSDVPSGGVSVTSSGATDTGLSVSSNNVVSGRINCSAKITVTNANGSTTRCATLTVVDVAGEVSLTPNEYYDDELEADGVMQYHNLTVTGGTVPDGMEVDNEGFLTGTPTTSGDFYFTVKGRIELSTGYYFLPMTFHARVSAPTTTTALSETELYAVEGETVSITIHGTVSNQGTYTATVTTTGGTLSTTSVTDGTVLSLICPQVNGTNDVTVTVTANVDGAEVSSAMAVIHVVDRLDVSIPAVGALSSR